MTKTIKKVQDVLEKAKRNGSAKNQPYEAELDMKGLRLYHYNTLIFHCFEGNIIRLGGYSESDANAIGTAMKFCGINIRGVSRAKSHEGHGHAEMNGWMIIE